MKKITNEEGCFYILIVIISLLILGAIVTELDALLSSIPKYIAIPIGLITIGIIIKLSD
jgi:hypothetical protein